MEDYLGAIDLFAFNYAPMNWVECAGQTLNIAQYQALYSLLSTKFGGNGSTTFCLPDLRTAALFPVDGVNGAMRYYIALTGIYPPRD